MRETCTYAVEALNRARKSAIELSKKVSGNVEAKGYCQQAGCDVCFVVNAREGKAHTHLEDDICARRKKLPSTSR